MYFLNCGTKWLPIFSDAQKYACSYLPSITTSRWMNTPLVTVGNSLSLKKSVYSWVLCKQYMHSYVNQSLIDYLLNPLASMCTLLLTSTGPEILKIYFEIFKFKDEVWLPPQKRINFCLLLEPKLAQAIAEFGRIAV